MLTTPNGETFDYCATSDEDNLEVSITASGSAVLIESKPGEYPEIYVNGSQAVWKHRPQAGRWHGKCGRMLVVT